MGQKDSCCYKERREERERLREARAVVAFGGLCLFKLAVLHCGVCGCCSRDRQRERRREDERAAVREAAGRQRNKLYRRDLGLVSSR